MDTQYKEFLRQQEMKRQQIKDARRGALPSRLRARLEAERALTAAGLQLEKAYG